MTYDKWFNNGYNKRCAYLDMNLCYKYAFMRSYLMGITIFKPPPGGAILVSYLIKYNVILARHLY